MRIELTDLQRENQMAFRRFSKREVAPHASAHDRQQRISMELIRKLAGRGYLGSFLSQRWGGLGIDWVTYGLLHEELGKSCSNMRTLLTVHDMVAMAILKWGSEDQRETWLPRLARGETIGAFALTEPNAGSDAKNIETTATQSNGSYVINGRKKWTTFGQIADLFLVFAICGGKPTAFLVERDTPGISTRPMRGLLGMRGSMLIQMEFNDCVIPKENLVGREGFGMSSVAFTALGVGRYTVAWGSVAIAQAALEACLEYTAKRKQFGVFLKEHQLIQQMISNMITNVKTARLMCYQAGYFKDMNDPREIQETFIAKYFASTIAMKAATDAVQIHGGNGCSRKYPVERYFRDAKIMEIIEGSSQIQQMLISKFGFQEYEQQKLEEAMAEEVEVAASAV